MIATIRYLWHSAWGVETTVAEDIGASTQLTVWRGLLIHIHMLQMYEKIVAVLLRGLHHVGLLTRAFQSAAFMMQDKTSQADFFQGLLKAIVPWKWMSSDNVFVLSRINSNVQSCNAVLLLVKLTPGLYAAYLQITVASHIAFDS